MEYPYIDFENRIYHVDDKQTLTLQTIPVMGLMLLRSTQTGKPTPPSIETKYGDKGTTVIEKNYYDPGYLKAVDDWEQDKQLNITKYLLWFGVKETVPEDVEQLYKDVLPDLNKGEVKYMWICSIIPIEKFNDLTQAILGQNTVTEKGLEQVAESFPNNGESQAN